MKHEVEYEVSLSAPASGEEREASVCVCMLCTSREQKRDEMRGETTTRHVPSFLTSSTSSGFRQSFPLQAQLSSDAAVATTTAATAAVVKPGERYTPLLHMLPLHDGCCW